MLLLFTSTREVITIGYLETPLHLRNGITHQDVSVGINASIRKVGSGFAGMAYGGTSFGDIIINIDGAKYSNENSLAEAIAETLQNMTDRRAAVYA